jgi:hypothetical protein
MTKHLALLIAVSVASLLSACAAQEALDEGGSPGAGATAGTSSAGATAGGTGNTAGAAAGSNAGGSGTGGSATGGSGTGGSATGGSGTGGSGTGGSGTGGSGTGGSGTGGSGTGGVGGELNHGSLDPSEDVTLAYDPIEGPLGLLHGAAYGIGYSGTWSAQSETSTDHTIVAGSLEYAGLARFGQRAAGKGYSGAGRMFAVMPNGPFSEYRVSVNGTDRIGASGKSIWASVLMVKGSASDTPTMVALGTSGIAWYYESHTPVTVGYFGADSDANGKRYWSLRTVNDAGTGQGSVVRSSKELVIGQPALLVLKLTFGSPSQVALFVDPPDLMGVPPASPDAQASTSAGISFRTVMFHPSGGNDGHAGIDEVRIGRTYASVTPKAGIASYYWQPAPATIPADNGLVVNRVRVFPRKGYAGRLVNAKIRGSNNSPTNDFHDIGTLSIPPGEGAWTDYVFPSNSKMYRYVKLVSPENGYANVAEIEFYSGSKRLVGTGFGSAGSYNEDGNVFENALDGDSSTYFNAATPSDAYVGLDLGTAETQVAAPAVSPEFASLTQTSVQVTMTTATSGAVVRYTTDGSWPSRTNGTIYASPVTFTKASTPGGRGKLSLKIIAYKDGLFDSVVTSGVYKLDYTGIDRTSFHLGNSLTDTINGHFAPISAACNKDHTYYRSTIPGAPTDWIWNHDGSCLGEPYWSEVYDNNTRYGLLTDQSQQPFSGHGRSVENETTYGLNFLAAARAGGSTGIQHWIYAQWPDAPSFGDNYSQAKSTLGTGYSWAYPTGTVDTYEKACLNHMRYFESLKAAMDAAIAADPGRLGTKQVKVVPSPLALYQLLRDVYGGNTSSFFSAIYEDGLHLTARGQYFIAALFYAAFFNESPVCDTTHYASLGIASSEATQLQNTAWLAYNNFSQNPSYWPNAKP